MSSCLLLWRPPPPRAPCSACGGWAPLCCPACCSRAGRLPQRRQQLSGSFACCSRNTEMLLFLRLDFLCVEWTPELSCPHDFTRDPRTEGRECICGARTSIEYPPRRKPQCRPDWPGRICRRTWHFEVSASRLSRRHGRGCKERSTRLGFFPRIQSPHPAAQRDLSLSSSAPFPSHPCLSFPDRLLWARVGGAPGTSRG